MNKRAVIYARVSTDMQRDNFSIPSQLNECKEFIEDSDLSLVGDRYVDPETGFDTLSENGSIPAYVDDFSSRELSRPSLDACIRFLETTGFDILVIHSLDRLARDPYIRQTLEREIDSFGAKVLYVLGSYDDTPEGEVRKDLDATFAKWENAKRVERSNRGKRGKAKSGKWVGGRTPFGYKRDILADCGLSVDEFASEAVKEIFSLYTDKNYSIRGITEYLTEQEIPPQSGGCKWAKSSVARILNNKTYTGSTFFNKTKRNGKGIIYRDREEWIEIKVPHIIDEGIFQEAQLRLKENKRISRSRPSRFYLLSGKVFCAICGKPYISQSKKAGTNRLVNDALSYRHRTKENHCFNRIISARKLEPIVWNEIVRLLLDPNSLRQGYEKSLDQQQENLSRQRNHLDTLNKKLQNLKNQRQKLTNSYLDPEIPLSRGEYIEEKTRIDGVIQQQQSDIELLELQLETFPLPGDFDDIEEFTEKISLGINVINIMPDQKRKILDMLHVKVFLDSESSVRLDGWFDPISTCLSSTSS